ncbi:hypothetical protein SS05631_c05830 [Sinorhizobium sp. CCBAU 05631]|nr:hypothetical protein SS05631_c05830 [Sinorhizobium sp. CCBAU 05631]
MRPQAQVRFGFLPAAPYLFLRKRQRQFWTPRPAMDCNKTVMARE